DVDWIMHSFFFSSRRRHTRFSRDWSSDVCSSDLRGTAATMAHDLGHGPRTGVHLVACGDAHVSNFGLFASPERRVVFDLNDFDEAADAPWEWDVKRLATSMYVGGRDKGMTESECFEAARLGARGSRG